MVCVDLGRVVRVRAVVTAVPHLVLVVVGLARVEEQLAVVLAKQRENLRRSTGMLAGRRAGECESAWRAPDVRSLRLCVYPPCLGGELFHSSDAPCASQRRQACAHRVGERATEQVSRGVSLTLRGPGADSEAFPFQTVSPEMVLPKPCHEARLSLSRGQPHPPEGGAGSSLLGNEK